MTTRTLTAMQGLLADNTTGDIGAGDTLDFLASVFPPQFSGAYVYKSSTQVVSTQVETPIIFQVELYDTDNYADLASDNDALVIPRDGYYVISAGFVCTGGPVGSSIRVVTPVATWSNNAGQATFSPDRTMSAPPHFLSATNLVSASCFFQSGRTIDTGVGSFLAARYLGQAPV